jgi:hypothetical protein
MRPQLNSGTLGGRERRVSSLNAEQIVSVLRAVLGSDHRYRKFVRELAAPHADGLLHFWQSAILDALEASHGLVLPRRADELRALLPPLPEPPRLSAAAVPSWIRIDDIGGSAPVQASGRAGSWRWFFHARHNHWSLGAVRGEDGDPVSVGSDSDHTFYVEDEYGDLTDDASYMDLDEARFLIVRELTRLTEPRGPDGLSH